MKSPTPSVNRRSGGDYRNLQHTASPHVDCAGSPNSLGRSPSPKSSPDRRPRPPSRRQASIPTSSIVTTMKGSPDRSGPGREAKAGWKHL